MATPEMVERVARALAKAHDYLDDDTVGYRPGADPAWTMYVNDAVAAIEAMGEPTEEMLFAADWMDNGTRDAWRFMIAAALRTPNGDRTETDR